MQQRIHHAVQDPERQRAVQRLRFSPELEHRFRQTLRGRLRMPRAIMFTIIGLAFAFGPMYDTAIFSVDPSLSTFLTWLELGVVAPLMLGAAIATWLRLPESIVKTLQLAAPLAAFSAVIILRNFALRGAIEYPASMIGVLLIAVAFFGGFSWRRVAAASAFFTGIAVMQEFLAAPVGNSPWVQAFPLFFMGIIAILGSYVQELLTRLNWWDLSRVREAQLALRESDRRFEAFMDHTPAIAWIKDGQGRYIYRNKPHRDRYGAPGEDWTGHSDAQHFPAVRVDTYADTDAKVLKTGEPTEFETLNHSRDGSTNEWLIQKFRFSDEAGRHYVAGMGVDIGERNRLQQLLRESEARFQAFLDNSPTVTWMKDGEGRYLYVSKSYKQFLGVADDSWRGRTDFDYYPKDFAQSGRELDLQVLASGGASEVQGPATGADGVTRHWLLTRFAFSDHTGRLFVGGVANDVTVRKVAEDIVRLQSLTDELTGLYNRRGFALLVDQQLRQALRQRARCALLYVDLDSLKHINEQHGHDGGDQAITSVSEALRVAVRASDIVARIGGDEFVVFAMDCDDVEIMQRRLLEAVNQYNRSESLPYKLSVTVGISEFDPEENMSIEARMAEADQAMLMAKKKRRAA